MNETKRQMLADINKTRKKRVFVKVKVPLLILLSLIILIFVVFNAAKLQFTNFCLIYIFKY